jgi:peroxiredoxin
MSWLVALYCCAAPPGLVGVDDAGQDAASLRGGGEQIINFALLDHRGRCHELRRTGAGVVVLFFTGNGCPVARQSIWKLRMLQQHYQERSVTVWMINANPQDDRASIVQEAEAFRSDPLPILKDDTQGVARLLGVRRTCEAIAISTKDWRIFYRGAIDDQLSEGAMKLQPTENFLERALGEFLADKPISKAQTVARGCLIPFETDADRSNAPVSFSREIAPILVRKCVVCHRPGDVGSWVMSNYKKVKGMSAMIQEVILARRMPPWEADPYFGAFANDRSLTIAEAQTLLRWGEQGAPGDEGDDPLPAAAKPAKDWPLGPPDYVIRLPVPENVPATGVLDLRHQIIDAPFTNDVWIGALDVKPGNRRVLHHVTLRTINPGQVMADPVGIAGWNPGYTSARYPEGTGKRFKKGVRFHIDLHYTTIGTPQTDRTEIGFYLLPAAPKAELEARAVWDAEFSIPPGEPNLKTSALTSFDRDLLLYDFRPHMHYRGSWFKFELLHPNGQRETLLSVPRYDFNWQTTYILAEPKRVPAGAWLMCSGGFDNSARNPANPDPTKRLRWGEQSWDEMFIGHFSAALAPSNAP